MAEENGLTIRKLLENVSLYPVVSQTKTRKLLLTRLETKHNVTVLWYNIMQFFTRKMRGCNILFNFANKEILYVLYVSVIRWQETIVAVKKKKLYLNLLPWMPCCFPCSMDMRAPTRKHSISWKIIDSPHQSRPHKKILFSWYIISQKLQRTTIALTHQSTVKDKHLYFGLDYSNQVSP